MNISTFHELLDLHEFTIQSIGSLDYYQDLFDDTLDAFGLTPDSVVKMTDPEEIYSFWNGFWNRLPDSKAIRREPFFSVCDLAEGDYLVELEDE